MNQDELEKIAAAKLENDLFVAEQRGRGIAQSIRVVRDALKNLTRLLEDSPNTPDEGKQP